MNPGQIRKWTPVKNHFLDLGGWFPYFDCLSGREWIIFIYINKMFLHYTSYKFTYPYWAGRMVGNPCLRVGRGKLAEIQKQIILSLNIFKFLIFFKLKKPTPPKLIKNTNLEFLSWLSRDKALSSILRINIPWWSQSTVYLKYSYCISRLSKTHSRLSTLQTHVLRLIWSTVLF